LDIGLLDGMLLNSDMKLNEAKTSPEYKNGSRHGEKRKRFGYFTASLQSFEI
jgi:hypothetical protein